jgi:ribonuclease J
MKVCIHRGTREIGGTCIEIEAQGKRIALDVGLPLGADDTDALLPAVEGFRTEDPDLLALVISHPHQDHYGLARHVRPDVRVLIGDAAHRILQAAKLFTPGGIVFENTLSLRDRQPVQLGPFEITPFLVDHSAYDAYALMIAADGKRVFYSGDFRAHGRKAPLFDKLARDPPKGVDVLLMEGTVIGRAGAEPRFLTETDLEEEFAAAFKVTPGLSLIWSSGQNIDRLVTIFRACRRTDRQFVIDLYTAEILKAADNPRLPQGTWNGVRVFLPEAQRRRVKRDGLFDLLHRIRGNRIFPEALRAEAARTVLLFRPSMMGDLDKADALKDARLIYSLWGGYLNEERLTPFKDWLARHAIPLNSIHTSGHASVADLRRFAAAIAPRILVPIHSFETGRFSEFFENVTMKRDGDWWDVI